ncbi:MAG: iron-sulfur cluster repair di-iron protein [Spirochaetota bacterium]
MDRSEIEIGAEALEMTVGSIVADDYRTARVFEDHGIDYCCGGLATLSAACLAKNLDPRLLLDDLGSARQTPADRSQNFAAWELPFLADFIVNTHHSWLRENDPAIVASTAKIASVHGLNHPELVEISRLFAKIAADMIGHLKEEEEVLFPAVRRLAEARKSGSPINPADKALIAGSLASLGRDHEEIGAATHEIGRLSANYALPPDACTTYTLAYRRLAEFEEDLHRHVHLENNILFPKAAALA